jgi:hypothetical protein
MKNFIYLFVFVSFCFSCQKKAYVSSIPTPTFDYYTSTQEVKKQHFKPAVEENVPITNVEELVAVTPENATTISPIETTTVPASQPKKVKTTLTLKQRITQRMIERKLTKMGVLKNTQPNATKTDGVSVASFLAAILGIVGLFATGWLFLIGMIAAIVLGFIGLSRVRHSNGQLKGRGWAIAGVVLGFLELVLLILGVLFVAASISRFGA